MGVSTPPGATYSIRMPGQSRLSTCSCRTSARTPHLLMTYAAMSGTATCPITEPTTTMLPVPCVRMTGSTWRARLTEPSRLVATTWSNTSAGTSSTRP